MTNEELEKIEAAERRLRDSPAPSGLDEEVMAIIAAVPALTAEVRRVWELLSHGDRPLVRAAEDVIIAHESLNDVGIEDALAELRKAYDAATAHPCMPPTP